MSFWIAMETNPDLNDKIEAMFALGPVARLNNVISPIKYAAPYVKYLKVSSITQCNKKHNAYFSRFKYPTVLIQNKKLIYSKTE